MLPEISPVTADALRTALDRAGYRTDGVRVLLGREAHAAIGRGEPEPAFRATADGGPLGVLVRMLLLGSVEPDAAVTAALAPLAPADAAAAGLLRRGDGGWAAALDLRPHGADDGGDWWVLSALGTWQRDAGLDLHSPAARAQAGAWLDWLAAQKVEAVGFGFLTLRRIDPGRTDATPTVVVEDLPDDLTDPLGPEVAGWLDRVDWLRAHARDDALLDARLRLTDGVVLERWATAGGPTAGDGGWVEAGSAVARAEGPRWRHEVDEPAAALLAGCRGALPLRDIVELLAFAHDRPVDALVAAALRAVRELVRHGLLVPVP